MAERPAKVSYGFILLKPSDKGAFGDHVIAMMTENVAVFPLPDVALVDLTAANKDLQLKIQLAISGDREWIQERDASERRWEVLFRKQALYVQRIAVGNKLIIVQSGYKSTRTEVPRLGKPEKPVVDAWGNKSRGSIHAQVKKLGLARSMVFIASTLPIQELKFDINDGQLNIVAPAEAQLSITLNTKRKVTLKGLRSGTKYHIAAVGFNATGLGEVSYPTDVIAP